MTIVSSPSQTSSRQLRPPRTDVLAAPARGVSGASRTLVDSASLDTQVISLRWVLRLRWSAIFGQGLTAVAVQRLLGISLPLGTLGAILGLATATNLIAFLASRRQPPREGWVAGLMVFDVMALTALLYFTGGPTNPFSFLYLVPIALATLVLRPAWTWSLVLLSLVGSAFLFWDHRPIDALEGHAEHMKVHLRGMWVAFGVAAGFIVYFLLRVRRALTLRDEALAESREAVSRQRRLTSLATLAAGAAHELATPLGTIAVVSHELARRADFAASSDRDDVLLIRSEVERCRTILNRMSYPTQWGDHGAQRDRGARTDGGVRDASEGARPPSFPSPWSLDTVLARTLGALSRPPWLHLDLAENLPEGELPGLDEAFVQALCSVIRNAEDAAPKDGAVHLVVRHSRPVSLSSSSLLTFTVRDEGQGMEAAVLARVGEPFFTTKAPGRGMGLGLFLARTVVERLGGSLTLDSEVGRGTSVTLVVPFERSA